MSFTGLIATNHRHNNHYDRSRCIRLKYITVCLFWNLLPRLCFPPLVFFFTSPLFHFICGFKNKNCARIRIRTETNIFIAKIIIWNKIPLHFRLSLLSAEVEYFKKQCGVISGLWPERTRKRWWMVSAPVRCSKSTAIMWLVVFLNYYIWFYKISKMQYWLGLGH